MTANRLHPALLLASLLVVGCHAAPLPATRVRLDDEGSVYVYLQRLPAEAARLRIGVAALSARRADGGEIPLSLSTRDLKREDSRRQRLLGVGHLPPGDYAGFTFSVSTAAIAADRGESPLIVPDVPTAIDFRFTVRRGEASVVALALREGAVGTGREFTAAFSAFTPERPAVGVMGFVANAASNDVTVFDKNTLEVFDVMATGRGPSSVVIDVRARRVFIALARDHTIEVLDLLSGRIVAERIRLMPGDEPVALALTADGRTLLAANRGSNTVSVIDPVSRLEVVKIPVGNAPRAIAIDPNDRRAFVFNGLSNAVSVIDVRTRTLVRSIATDPRPVQGDFNRRGDRLYVIHENIAYVTVIAPDTLTVVRRFPVRSSMEAIKVDRSSDLVYLAGRGDFNVGVYDPFSFAAVGFVDGGGTVTRMATDGEKNTLYLVSAATDRVFVTGRISRRLVGVLDVGDGPTWISVMGEN